MAFSNLKLSSLLLLLTAALAFAIGCNQCAQDGDGDATYCEDCDETAIASVDYSMAEPGEVLEIKSETDFANFINSNQIAIVKFGAEWCGPCKSLDPHFDKMAGYFQVSGLSFARIDVDRLNGIAREYGVSGIPDTFIFIGGKVYTHVVGNGPASIANAINSVCQQTISVEEAQKETRLEDELWGDEPAPEDAPAEEATPAEEVAPTEEVAPEATPVEEEATTVE